jgi:serine/threonine-protein kinase HipA
MNRKAEVWMHDLYAGELAETDSGYCFQYDAIYLNTINAKQLSFSFPMQQAEFLSNVLFPFFDGLIPEGWLLNIVEKNWKLNQKDRMGILLACCKNCIGAVSIVAKKS